MLVLGLAILAVYGIGYLSWTRWPKRDYPQMGYARGTIFGTKFGKVLGAALVVIGLVTTILGWLRQ